MIEIHVLHMYLTGLVHSRTQDEVNKCVKELMAQCPPKGHTLEVIKECTAVRRQQIRNLEENGDADGRHGQE